MHPVDWDRLSPQDAEDLLSALLVRVIGAERIDGSGGDDGADLVRMSADGLHVYEVKRFSKRLSTTQKSQIEKSLRRAVERRTEMTCWHLVIPLDHTPSEERWFDDLRRAAPDITLHWYGRTAIEVDIAAHPSVARAFLPGGPEQLALKYLAAASQESAGLANGIVDALPRFAGLGALLDETDPDFRFEVSTSSNSQSVSIIPRDAAALARRPITGRLRLQAQAGTPGGDALEAFMNYGTPLTEGAVEVIDFSVDGLPQGLSELLSEGQPVSAAIEQGPFTPVAVQVVLRQAGVVTARRQCQLTESTSGILGGSRAVVADVAGGLSFELQREPGLRAGSTLVRVSLEGLPIHVALDLIGFARALQVADSMDLHSQGKVDSLDIKGRADKLAPQLGLAEEILSALQRIQDVCGAALVVQPSMTPQEISDVFTVDTLLREGEVRAPLFGGSLTCDTTGIREAIDTQVFPRIHVHGVASEGLVVANQSVIPPGSVELNVTNLVVTNGPKLRRLLHASRGTGQVSVEIEPDNQSSARIRFRP